MLGHKLEGKERLKKETDLQLGDRIKQGDFHTRHALGSPQFSTSTRPEVYMVNLKENLKVCIEAFTRLDQCTIQTVSTTHYSFKAASLGQLLAQGRQEHTLEGVRSLQLPGSSSRSTSSPVLSRTSSNSLP